MKYIKPSMTVVKLQHQSIICQSVNNVRGMNYGGASTNYDDEVRTRESSSVWDNEW